MRTHVGKDAQRHTDDGRVSGTHAVHAVVQVGSVAHRSHHQDGHDHEEYPAGSILIVATKRHDARVIQIVPLDKGNRCFQRFARFGPVFDHHFLSLALDREILVHLHVGRSPEHKPHYQTYAYLADDLVTALEPLLVVAENLDKIVHSTEESQPYRGDDHQDEVDVAQAAEQQHGDEDGDDDDDAAHRRHTYLLHAKGVDARVALHLGDLLAFQKLDKLLAKPCRDDQREDERQQCPERDVPPQVRTADAKLL